METTEVSPPGVHTMETTEVSPPGVHDEVTASSVQKPLPAIPQVPGTSPLAVLSDESKIHLSKFVRHIFAQDEKLFASQDAPWPRLIEAALDDLGQSVLNGDWMAGLKLNRQWMRSWKDETRQLQEVEVDQRNSAGKKHGNSVDKTYRPNHIHSPSSGDDSAPSAPIAAAINHPTALDQLRLCLSREESNRHADSVNHLVLCVASFESHSFSTKEHKDPHPTPGCVFKVQEFALPDDEKRGGLVLCGLDEWEVDAFVSGERVINVVGGTFYFQGVDSLALYDALFKVLRLSVYFHQSLVLEQHFLGNSHAEMHFTAQSPPPQITQPSPPAPEPVELPSPKARKRQSHVTSGILSLISRTGSFVSRAASLRRMKTRSFDQPPSSYRGTDRSTSHVVQRLRRFSFTSGSRSSSSKQDQKKDEAEPPFASALKHIEQSGEFLSTSIGVSFEPPFLLARLAEKEKNETPFHLKGDEKAGLHTVLGWDKKNARWKGLSGTPGFVRHQTFSVLHSQVPVPQALLPTPTSETPSSSSLALQLPTATTSKCSIPHWVTFRHYSRTSDKPLGEAIIELCSNAKQRCKTPECQVEMSQHEQRYIHDGLVITVKLSPCEGGKSEDGDDLGLWLSCKICKTRTKRSDMSDGTYLFSFSKYLETLVYSKAVYLFTPSLCEHTATPSAAASAPDSPSAPSRLNILRHFSYTTWVVSFSLSAFEPFFELRVPRLQIIRDKTRNRSGQISSSTNEVRYSDPTSNPSEEKKILRREILLWWQGISEWIDQLELSFPSSDSVISKALPRLPSIYDDSDDQDDPAPAPLPDPTPSPPIVSDTSHGGAQSAPKPTESVGVAIPKVQNPAPRETDPARLLTNLRLTFQGTERALYAQLTRTQVCSLNDVRWSFRSMARVAIKRLSAWESKHLPKKAKSQANNEQIAITEPDWWGNGCHAVPGGNVILREGDWGSIIAYTLSSVNFQNELAKMSPLSPASSSTDTPPPSASPPTTSNVSSTMTSSQSFKFFGPGSQQYPDPDQDDLWQETEPFSATITRKRHPRDPSSILSLRDVLRHRSPANGSTGHSSSLLSNLVTETPPETPGETKPEIEVSKDESGGGVTVDSETDVVSRILNDVEGGISDSPPESSIPKEPDPPPTQQSSSLVSVESDGTARPGGITPRPASAPPTKDDQPSDGKNAPTKEQTSSTTSSAPPSSFTTSLTSGLSNAMRLVLKTGDSRRRVTPQAHKHQHGPPQVETVIDEHPHINYEWTIGKRLKFSCTVYYAKQFDHLRRQCGLDDEFVKSLSRSSNWTAEGGKSKSNFWKTSDGRFIIKTLVDAWNVADLQVLVDLAPSYFNYVDSTACKPTVLAKLLGFYTIEIKNMETGSIQSKADLLVMENLFHEQNVVKTFDLKGIPGRKVKANSDIRSGQKTKTMFDGEWIEGQQRATILLRPHSKVVLQEALESDSEFLARSNIMDYSLLLGVDEENRQIACGLVDTIGSYTFAKTLEYKAKHGLLQAGKDVTVIPPAEYRERFVSALNRYFLACPDKWSRPLDGSNVDCDPMHLPSVL